MINLLNEFLLITIINAHSFQRKLQLKIQGNTCHTRSEHISRTNLEKLSSHYKHLSIKRIGNYINCVCFFFQRIVCIALCLHPVFHVFVTNSQGRNFGDRTLRIRPVSAVIRSIIIPIKGVRSLI